MSVSVNHVANFALLKNDVEILYYNKLRDLTSIGCTAFNLNQDCHRGQKFRKTLNFFLYFDCSLALKILFRISSIISGFSDNFDLKCWL